MAGFAGIAEVILVTADLERALGLYRDHLGFTVAAEDVVTEERMLRGWGVESGSCTVVSLVKTGAAGGHLRLVHDQGRSPVPGGRRMGTPGPFSIDFYVRDIGGLHDRLTAAGWTFRSPIQRYRLFGTDFEVEEALLEGPEGLLHAFVGYLPGQHRCILGADPESDVSEVVAAITLVDPFEDGLAVLRDVLGGEVYFDQVFSGGVIERMLDLPEGSAFRAVLLRGPSRANARAELMAPVDGEPPSPEVPAVRLRIDVEDLDDVLRRLTGAELAVVSGPEALPAAGAASAPQRVAWVDSHAGLRLELRGG
jgi:catechol 2,3-dioxygenase-like lactoylglutathione lyase family enzyme